MICGRSSSPALANTLVVVAVCLVASATGASDQTTSAGSLATGTDPPSWSELLTHKEAWLYNPRERTQAALRALEEERPEEAVAAAALARKLDPGNGSSAFNEGTVSLLSGDPQHAARTLAPLAQVVPEAEPAASLAEDAAYNLGNAHYHQQQFAQAIDWYRETLRRDPSRLEAKINLELAMREQEQQHQRQDRGQNPDRQQQQEQQQPSEQQPGDDTDQQPANGEQDQQEQPGEERSPLPRFQPRPDMTAEEAASLLEAVEAMEREARAAMQPESRRQAPGDRDW